VTTNVEALLALLDRAMADPDLLEQLMGDPFGVAVAAGLRVTPDDLKRVLGIHEATDEELL
jgi:hypothetical protein